MVRFENVSKKYNQLEVVKNLNLEINEGELVTLIGPSGCGKTTTLKMINRLIEPTSGTIYVNGEDIRKQDPVQLRRGIGYVIQQIGLFPNMTIAQNIAVVGKLLGWSKEKAAARVEELLEMVNMDPASYMDRYPKELSGGQQQRIGVLRALAANPKIILMDEPFGALDPITREQLQGELKKLQAQLHKTIVFVTHDMDEALKIADRIVLMRDGEIVQAATPDQILRNPANDFVASFIGKDRLLRSPDEVKVEEVMITDPVTIEYNRGLAEALERMRKSRVDSLMVVDDLGSLLGVVTIKDVQSALNRGGTVGDSAAPHPIAVYTGQTVREAVFIMAKHNVGYLPVINDQNQLKGLITRASLVGILTDVLWPDLSSSHNVFTSTTKEAS
ncbi:MAG: betaine/proline/choline family ABC transporter ATP-binding protein [Firmicutes bacterium]|nr:betaine/proline/choline family ABC transporter ATP-binding protein [Bacillota bacterium]